MPKVRPPCEGLGRPGIRGGHAGLTLVELLVVLVLLSLFAGVAAPALRRRQAPVTWRARADAQLARARGDALAQGAPRTVVVPTPAGPARATAFPDGVVVADPGLDVEPLTGRRSAARDTATVAPAVAPVPPDAADAHRR